MRSGGNFSKIIQLSQICFIISKCPFSSVIKKLSLIGAQLRVLQAKNKCLIGCCGIVIIETSQTFQIVTKENIVKILPKVGCLFSFDCVGHSLQYYGSHLLLRVTDRIVKKSKTLTPPEEIYNDDSD